jgi:CRP-like cAMP-binding protein
VAARDFFAFCRSLPLLELKAIGELSQVRHFEENSLVFSAGDSGDELFIINHGLVEVTPEPFHPGMVATVLSRGDVFGEAGALLHLPRRHTARARDRLSLQCFRGQDFQELLRRAPSFFVFLCEKLANQLFQANEIGKSQEGNLGLSGSLANFDVVTIYQTIIRSMQTGLLTIADENGKTVCEFYFDNGAPRWGRFQHLKGEEAFWQLFIQTRPGWTFSFSKKALVRADWTDESAISRNPDEILIKAIHMRDEFEDLSKRMSDGGASLKRRTLNFVWPRTDLEELRPLAEEIWQIGYSQPISLTDLYGRCGYCALKVYRAVDEMVHAEIIALQNNNGEAPKPVEAAP